MVTESYSGLEKTPVDSPAEEPGENIWQDNYFWRSITLSRDNAGYKRFIQSIFVFLLISSLIVTTTGCARKGLIAEEYASDFYRVPKLLLDGPMKENPQFIFYGDSRPGWRFQEKFRHKRNWLTWKMLIVPFYEVYWLGNGAVGGVNRLRHVPDYGHKERLMVRDAVYEAAKRSRVDFIVHGGDMPTDGRRPSHWAKFLEEHKENRPLVSDFPFLPIVGNHERTDDKEYGLLNYQAIFEYPPFYVLDFPDAAIFVVDSNLIIDQYRSIDDDEQDALFQKWFVSDNSERPAWLEQELASRSQRFKIVIMHHPIVSVAKHYTDWTKPLYGRNLRQKREKLLSVLQQQGVRLVLAGHDHLYEHDTVRLSDYGGPGTHVAISGGAGAPLRSGTKPSRVAECCQVFSEDGLDVAMIRQMEIYHYFLVDIDSDKITIHVMEVTGDPEEPVKLADEIVIEGVGE